MLDEAKTMIRVSKHDHVVNFQGVCIHNDTVYLLLEFCSLGPIDNYLQKYRFEIEVRKRKMANCTYKTYNDDDMYNGNNYIDDNDSWTRIILVQKEFYSKYIYS